MANEPVIVSPDPLVRRSLLLSPKQWLAVALLALGLLGALEVAFRSGAVWRVPLPFLLSFENDRYTLVSWEVHQPKRAGDVEVIAVGSSVAAAVTELPDDEAQTLLRALSGRSNLRFLAMAVPRGCIEEMTVILENFIAQGRPPAVAVLFTWPGCYLERDEEPIRSAKRMPLRTQWLFDGTELLPASEVINYFLVQRIDVLRYRYMINTWIRRRLDEAAFGGERRFRIPYRPYRISRPAGGPLEALPGFDRYRSYPTQMDVVGGGTVRLDQLLARLKSAGVTPILVENPWSPPIQREFRGRVAAYTARMQSIAARHDVSYIDPNLSVDLEGFFNDILHPTHEGGRRYFRAIAPAVAAAVR